MLRLSIVFLFYFIVQFAFSQRYSFLTYSTEQGLPHSQVTTITQDERGFLWVGTLGGLARFNGKEFETFTSDNGLLKNRITHLGFIRNELWIGHEGGVSKMTSKGFVNWSLGRDERTTKISDIVSYKGEVIVATNGAGLYKVKGGELIKVKLPETDFERIRDLEIVSDELFIGTSVGLLKTSDLHKFKLINGTGDFSISSVRKKGSEIYFTTFQDGFFQYNPIRGDLKSYASSDSLLTLRFCFFDSNDRLWLNTMNGIWRLKDEIPELKLDESSGIPMESIQSIFEDKNGNIWFGSEGKGLLRFTGERFIYFNESSGLTSDLILNVNQERSGTFWLGTYDKGLIRMMPDGSLTNIEIGNNTIWSSLINVDGFNWFGTGSGLIAMKGDNVVKEYFYEEGTPGDKITTLYQINKHSFYVGGGEGVSIYRDGSFKRLTGDATETVRSFCRIGTKMYCASDKGLFIIKNDKIEQVGSFINTIYSLAGDDEGLLWIGTEEGLFTYDGSNIHDVPFSKDPTSNIINFLIYKNNLLYVGTNNGLYVLSSLNKRYPNVVKYGIGEGVVNLETNLNSAFIDRKGQLWFGTASGLVCFRPKYETGIISPPEMVLKKILLNYQNVDFKKYADEFDKYGFPKNLSLPYSKNNISFELDGIALANYPGMKFQYRLEGSETGWSPLNNNTTITYSSLPAGHYIFHARSIDARGNYSNIISVPFEVRQAFYRTWWFILLCASAIALIVYRMFKIRIKREREANQKEKLEFKSRLLTLEQRSLNASMNRHFIFNSLNSIQYFINTQDKLSANKFLTNFAKLIRKNLDSSEEGNMVTLSQELERLDLYLTLENMRFKDRFDYVIDCDPDIDKETVVIPAMILQPFVENSIIHGILPNEDKKGRIEVKIEKSGSNLIIRITDNGIGIEKSMKGKSDIDGDHRSQGMEITSKRIELLNKLSDQHFEINGPFQIEDEYHSINGTGVILKIQLENLDD